MPLSAHEAPKVDGPRCNSRWITPKMPRLAKMLVLTDKGSYESKADIGRKLDASRQLVDDPSRQAAQSNRWLLIRKACPWETDRN